MKRPLAYITAPWSNNQYENAENAATYCRQVYDAGYSPICPVLFLSTFLKDEIPQEHKDGLDMAHYYNPAITTIHQPVEEMAYETLRILFDQIRSKASEKKNQQKIFQARLVEGQSTRELK